MGENTDFSIWLQAQLNKRGWTNKELAHQAGIAPSSISMVLSGSRPPGLKFCQSVAKAFGVTPEEALRAAGVIPNKNAPSEEEEEKMLHHFRRLDPRRRKDIIEILRTLRALQEEEEAG